MYRYRKLVCSEYYVEFIGRKRKKNTFFTLIKQLKQIKFSILYLIEYISYVYILIS